MLSGVEMIHPNALSHIGSFHFRTQYLPARHFGASMSDRLQSIIFGTQGFPPSIE